MNGLNQLTAAGMALLGYDGKGNLNASGCKTYAYGQRNQMVGDANYKLFYDPLNRLDFSLTYATGTKPATGTLFDYDHDHLSTELAYPSGTMLRRYVFGPGADAPLVWYEGTTTTDKRWLIPDERGSIIAVTNASGTAIAVNSYDEYGITASTSPANMGRFLYTGQAWLPEVGLYYYKARLYSPTLGRFMQTDPIGYGDGINWYEYVGDDPIDRTDPSGLFFDEIKAVARGVLAADATDVATPDPTDASPHKWLGEAIVGTLSVVAIVLLPSDSPKPPGQIAPPVVAQKPTPSGKPPYHNVDLPSRKAAKDSARNNSGGNQSPIQHGNPQRGKPHFHSVNGNGCKKRDGCHYNYPGKPLPKRKKS